MTRPIVRLAASLLVAVASATGARADPAEEELRRARALLDERRYDEALSIVEPAIASQPGNDRALAIRAEIYRRTDRAEEARRDYETLSRLRPEDPDPWFWLGTFDRWGGNDPGSLSEYGRVIELAPCHLDALKGRARVRSHVGDAQGAEADLRAALGCTPGDAEATELLGAILVRRDAPGAEALLRQAFERVELERRLGNLMMSAKRPAEAAAHYRRALVPGAAEASPWRSLADAERECGRTDAALDAYRQAVRLDPTDTGSRYWIGVLATRAGGQDEALEAFDAILVAKPDDVGALVGKARLLLWGKRFEEALSLADRAVALRPDNGEARVLRASILAATGRTDEARKDYEAALTRNPGDTDARAGLKRLGPQRFLAGEAKYSRSQVVEGLEEKGLQIDGVPFVPTRLEYLTEGGGGNFGWRLAGGPRATGTFDLAREAATNLDRDFVIYDFDVLAAMGGLDHGLGARWRLSWRAGGVRYDPRSTGSIPSESHFKGSAELEWRDGRSRFQASYSRAPSLQRGFGADTQFRIFTQDRAVLSWERSLGRRFGLETSAGLSHFDDGNTPIFGAAGLVWERGEQMLALRYRHDPFSARFFTRDLRLDFIDYDTVSVAGRAALGRGFRLFGVGLTGRYGLTPRTVSVDVNGDGTLDRVPGPLGHNQQRLVDATLAWSPPGFRPLSLGAEYLYDHYDFDTPPYNNINTRSIEPFVELSGGTRWRYVARYARGFIDDERDSAYGSNTLFGRVEASLGRFDPRRGAISLVLEVQYQDNDLDEKREKYRFFLTVPF